ncbi:MAG: fdrA domain protein [Desulfofustis sp.]|nr:fdrA domain protein [Desulfofustis sp.]
MKTGLSPLNKPVRVINIGLEIFAEDIRGADVPVVQMDWRPPAGGDPRLIALLDRLAEEA